MNIREAMIEAKRTRSAQVSVDDVSQAEKAAGVSARDVGYWPDGTFTFSDGENFLVLPEGLFDPAIFADKDGTE